MKKRILAMFCVVLIAFLGMTNLFAAPAHECRKSLEQSDKHCTMVMEKMACCPAQQQENTCQCPEMNTHDEIPQDTSPAIFIGNTNISINYITISMALIKENAYTSQIISSKNFYFPTTHNKIYKIIHSFLI